MTIPSGNVGRIKAGHGLGFHDEILQALVERMTEVNRSIGVGRTVVQQVDRGALAFAPDLVVDPFLLPSGQ